MRRRLKNGGKPRVKAGFGVDGALMAAATLSAAAMNTAATIQAANKQANAVVDNARTQASSIAATNENNTKLQTRSIAATKEENDKNRQQQQDIQMTLQMLAGQQNMADRMEANKVAVKYGGNPNKYVVEGEGNQNTGQGEYMLVKPTAQSSFYGEARRPFEVTDGGDAVPIDTDESGYGLYELVGNDHDHYHKTKGGKYKSGVGLKFPTDVDAKFISKHNIGGFNPANAVNEGMNPEEAFALQEYQKEINGLNDDGSRTKSLKRSGKLFGGSYIPAAINSFIPEGGVVGAGIELSRGKQMPNNPINANIITNAHRSVKKCGGHTGRRKAKLGWGDVAGATYSGAGNLLGAGINMAGNIVAGNKLAQAYGQAGQYLTDAYNNLKTIDTNIINRDNYAPALSMAAIRVGNTNVNPQLERIRRMGVEQKRLINRSTMSSAARQQKLAMVDDAIGQKYDEQYAYKDNQDEEVKQKNAAMITEVSNQNAARQAEANKDYLNAQLTLAQYNNNIENTRILGAAQAQADAIAQAAGAKAQGLSAGMGALGEGFVGAASGFANAIDVYNQNEHDYRVASMNASPEGRASYAIATGDLGKLDASRAELQRYVDSGADPYGAYAAMIARIDEAKNKAKRNNTKINT